MDTVPVPSDETWSNEAWREHTDRVRDELHETLIVSRMLIQLSRDLMALADKFIQPR